MSVIKSSRNAFACDGAGKNPAASCCRQSAKMRLTKLSKAQRQTYDRQRQRCARKYQDQSGTMYRSFEAFCCAILAKDYSRRFAKD